MSLPTHTDPTSGHSTFSLTISPSSTIHPTTNPSQPLYYLPTSLSTHSINLSINRWTPTVLTSRSRDSLTENKLFTITKIPTTDTYTFTSHIPGRAGKGLCRFIPGWIWGGTWEVEFGFFDESLDKERRLVLKTPTGSIGPGTKWALAEGEVSGGGEGEEGEQLPVTVGNLGQEVVIAEEQSNKHSASTTGEGGEQFVEGAERGETILIYTGKQEVTEIVRELITVAWVTKCWSERTRGGWFGSSVKQKDSGAGGLKYNY